MSDNIHRVYICTVGVGTSVTTKSDKMTIENSDALIDHRESLQRTLL